MTTLFDHLDPTPTPSPTIAPEPVARTYPVTDGIALGLLYAVPGGLTWEELRREVLKRSPHMPESATRAACASQYVVKVGERFIHRKHLKG